MGASPPQGNEAAVVDIGSPLVGSVANAVLYADASGNLASNTNLQYVPATGLTLGAGSLIANDLQLTKTAPSISSGTLTLNLSTANAFVVSLNANITTMTVSNPGASGKLSSFILVLTGDGTARTIVWPVTTTWINNGGVAPTPTSTNNKRDKYTLFTYDGGTNWFATIDAQNY